MLWARYFIEIICNLLSLAILARVLISWLNVDPYHPAVTLINQITEPILKPLRDIIPPVGRLDISPIVALFILQFIERILLSITI
jgi:YggT family protein